MGDGFFRSAEESYRRALMLKLRKHLPIEGLFLPPEEKRVQRYPCRLRDNAEFPELGTFLLLHMPEKSDRILVIQGKLAIGSIDGDAGKDLRKRFLANPDLCGLGTGRVVEVSERSRYIEIEVETKTVN